MRIKDSLILSHKNPLSCVFAVLNCDITVALFVTVYGDMLMFASFPCFLGMCKSTIKPYTCTHRGNINVRKYRFQTPASNNADQKRGSGKH
jgi:hypothetical protein